MNSFVDIPAMVAACRAACGTVHLVGAGPGDPDLLTLRAARLLAQADVVVYDHLVGPEVLALIGADAERIYVGKERSHHSMAQDDINALLVRLARAGRQVVRLKGGDPFVFGRGGEELQVLAAAGVPFEVVPGITAACGVASYAGIPLTHRDYAQSCTFVTGHLKDGSCDLDWPALARPRQTVVIYMGLSGLADHLRATRRARPAAALAGRRGGPGHARQRSAWSARRSTRWPTRWTREGLQSPCLTIVGEVVRLRDELAWFRGQQWHRARLRRRRSHPGLKGLRPGASRHPLDTACGFSPWGALRACRGDWNFCIRLGPDTRLFDLPSPEQSPRVRDDGQQCGNEIDGRGTRTRPSAGALGSPVRTAVVWGLLWLRSIRGTRRHHEVGSSKTARDGRLSALAKGGRAAPPARWTAKARYTCAARYGARGQTRRRRQ